MTEHTQKPTPTVTPESALSIGNRLHKERRRLKLSETQLGEKCGKPEKTILKYQSGKKSPNAHVLALMAHAGVDAHYVLTGHSNVGLRKLQAQGDTALGPLSDEQERELNTLPQQRG